MGFRRYKVQPIYSQNSTKDSSNIHRHERLLQVGRSSVATVYGPAVFGKAPCILHRETEDVNGNKTGTERCNCFGCRSAFDSTLIPFGSIDPILVSTGMFMNTVVKYIVSKRIILTEHTLRVHKRSAVIRYIFLSTGKGRTQLLFDTH